MSNVIQFSNNQATTMTEPVKARARVTDSDKKQSFDEMDIDKLYPSKEILSPLFAAAIKLTEKAFKYSTEALESFKANDQITSDDSMTKLLALLPELFCCKEIGDGYGAIVLSLFHALKNNDGSFLNKDQLININYTLKRLNSEPLMTFESALELLNALEEADLSIESKEFDYLSEVLGE